VLARCLDSVERQRLDGDLETIVVDDASTDGTGELLRGRAPAIRVLTLERNSGFSEAINRGARAATGEVLFLLNSDVEFLHPDAMQLLATALRCPRVGLVAPRYERPDGSLQPGCAGHPTIPRALLLSFGAHHLLPDRLLARLAPSQWSHDRSRNVDWIMGAVVGVEAEIFQRVGGYWPLMYGSEQDLAWKVGALGYSVRYVSESRVRHVGNYSNRQRFTEPGRAARVARSELIFLRQHYGRFRRTAIRLITGAGYGARAVILPALGRSGRAAEYRAMAGIYLRGPASPLPG
jgi:GT2 family glycosyltransferase